MKQVSSILVMHKSYILLGKRRDTGLFSAPGGGFEPGETPFQAAVRELWEESGIKTNKLVPIGETKKTNNSVKIHRFFLEGFYPTTTKFDPDREMQFWKWCDLDRTSAEELYSRSHHGRDDSIVQWLEQHEIF